MIEFATDLWNTLLDFLYWLIDFAFGWLNLPQFPEELTTSIDTFLSLIFDNVSLLGFFIRPMTLKIVIPVLIILVNFEYIYHLVMWLIKKLPFLNIK